MNWQLIVQCLNLTLGIFLIIKLFRLKLHKIYGLFCLFLMADLFGSTLWLLSRVLGLFSNHFYIITWLVTRPIVWLFTLLMIYSLLGKILSHLPGLLRLSKRVLHVVFLSATVLGLVSIRLEYSAPGFAAALSRKQLLFRCWTTELVLDRVIISTALFSLVVILTFLLWFPVTIPRNLAVFSVGLSVYFAGGTVFLLLRSFWPDETLSIVSKLLGIVSVLLGGISSACFAFWLLLLSPAGETVPSALTVQRQPQEQERLVAQLELINNALLKSARR
jgi:hypothetical protein